MSDFIQIVPKPIITTTDLVGFKIDGVHVNLFNGAIVRVIIYDSPMSISRIDTVQLTKEEYNGWGDDDNYIINIICEKLGFTRPVPDPIIAPVVEPVVEPIVEPVVEPIVEPVVEPIVEPVVEPIVEPVVEPVVEPTTDTQPII